MSIFILKENFKDADFVDTSVEVSKNTHDSRVRTRSYYAWSEAGRLTSKLLAYIMGIFRDHWKMKHPGINPLLFGDNLLAHGSTQAVGKVLYKRMFLF